MLFLIPIGRETRLAKLPWATFALILMSILVYLNTWPLEVRFVKSRLPSSPLILAATDLVQVIHQASWGLSKDVQDQLAKEIKNPLFPTEMAETLFKSVDKQAALLPLETRVHWEEAYKRYTNIKDTLRKQGVPAESIFAHYGFNPSRAAFPGLFSHLFLHAGFIHLLFNMLFLWMVGCSIEERWGPPIFLLIYFTGGFAAAFAQEFFHSVSGVGMVGASGAVAAIMGSFLIRHFKMPIRIFYFFIGFGARAGVFTAPAWILLLLWLVEQLFWGLITRKSGGVSTGYWAHIGGFVYGTLVGFLIRQGQWASGWEKEAESTETGQELRIEEANKLFREGHAKEASLILDGLLTNNPDSIPVILEALKINEYLEDRRRAGTLMVRALRLLLDAGRIVEAEQHYTRWKPNFEKCPLAEKDIMSLADSLRRLDRFYDALITFSIIVKQRPNSPFRGRAIYSAGKLFKEGLHQPNEAARCFKELLKNPYDLEWGMLAESELKSLSSVP